MIFSTKYASNKKTQGVGYNYGGFRGSVGMGIPWGFPWDFAVGMGRVWGLKCNPHGSLAVLPFRIYRYTVTVARENGNARNVLTYWPIHRDEVTRTLIGCPPTACRTAKK